MLIERARTSDPDAIEALWRRHRPAAVRFAYGLVGATDAEDLVSEAFANIYREAYKAIRAELAGKKLPVCDYPTVDDGITGVAFIETLLASNKSKGKWTRMKG